MTKYTCLLQIVTVVIVIMGSAMAGGILPPGECSGIIGNGYGVILILPDRGDGKVHGRGTFQTDYDKARGAPSDPGIEFVGSPRPDGSVDLRRMDGTLYFDAVRIANNVFIGRWHSTDGQNTAPASFPCK